LREIFSEATCKISSNDYYKLQRGSIFFFYLPNNITDVGVRSDGKLVQVARHKSWVIVVCVEQSDSNIHRRAGKRITMFFLIQSKFERLHFPSAASLAWLVSGAARCAGKPTSSLVAKPRAVLGGERLAPRLTGLAPRLMRTLVTTAGKKAELPTVRLT